MPLPTLLNPVIRACNTLGVTLYGMLGNVCVPAGVVTVSENVPADPVTMMSCTSSTEVTNAGSASSAAWICAAVAVRGSNPVVWPLKVRLKKFVVLGIVTVCTSLTPGPPAVVVATTIGAPNPC